MEGIIVRPPQQPGALACGGQPMVDTNTDAGPVERLAAADDNRALIGKRYVDEASGLEVLCTKQGLGALSFDGRPLSLKQAKPLPSSD
jgi:hypothetical protein